MAKEFTKSTLSLAIGTAFTISLATAPVANAAENPFATSTLNSGYMVAMNLEADANKEGKEGKCGEGKCGDDKADKEGKCGGDKADKEGKCGEGKCGGDKADKEGKCGEGKCGGDKADKEGKCGEGKCGGDKADGDKADDADAKPAE
ncbi:low-complexity protein [Candidatus Albibeggiatoa sp. nov. BB20]|uniref:HvfA family oxazolone/thioamide-modified RiPP metallophore n=1 Tax=Candidatus Albibeggiatoa sp. nov. BB20 TaxID=3162723 RepID=UPI003365B0EF